MKDIYCEMGEWEKKLYNEVSSRLSTNFEAKGDFVSIDSMWSMIDELYFYLKENDKTIEEMERENGEQY